MRFCKRCGNVMLPVRKGRKTYLACSSCGYKEKEVGDTKLTTKEKPESVRVIESDSVSLPRIKVLCPRCSNREAYWWSAQGSKEEVSEAVYYRCTKCGYVWREE